MFSRAHREITLTPEGEAFYRAVRDAIEAVEAADTAVFSGTAAREPLRIRSMPIFAQTVLGPKIPQFCALHPQLRLELQLRIDPGNLMDDGMDVAIHVGRLDDSSLVATRFASTRWIICAAPSYLAIHGAPADPSELAKHRCLNFIPSIAASVWTVRTAEDPAAPIAVKSDMLSNQAAMLVQFARAGMGITRLTEFQIADDLAEGRLVELFPEHQCHTEDPIYAVYQTRKHLSNRVRVFLDFLRSAFEDPPPWRHWRKDWAA